MELLIVNYHYFREDKPKSGIYPLTIKEFEFQLNEISRNYEFISEEKIINLMNTNQHSNMKYCLLTFDDGLKEQMQIADLLIQKKIPGIFYVCSEPMKNKTVLDVHKLHYIRSILDDSVLYDQLDEKYNISDYKFNYDFLSNQYRYDNELSRKVKYFMNFVLKDKEKEDFINSTFSNLVDTEEEFSKKLYMDKQDLIKLSEHGMLGSHCANHLPLATLSKDCIKYEIESSLDYLESIVGKNKINSISYPYGGKSSISNDVIDIVKYYNLKFGLTMFRGVNTLKDFKNQFLLKRIDTNDAPAGKNHDVSNFSD